MQFTLRDILNVIFRYARALVVFWVVVLVAALVFYSQTNKLYDSTAKVLISLGSEAAGKAEYLNGKNLQVLQREQQIHDEQQILESHDVLFTTAKWILGDSTPGLVAPVDDSRMQEARRYFTGQEPESTFLLRVVGVVMKAIGSITGKKPTHDQQVEDVAQSLSKALTVKAIFDSDAMDVSFRYRDARVAQTVLTLILASYLDHHIAVFQSAGESDLLKSQLDRSVNQYQARLGEFSNYMNQHRVYNDEAQGNTLIEQREKLKQALDEATADNDAAAARLATLNSINQSLQKFERYSTTEVRNKQRDELSSKLNEAILEEQALLNRHPKGSRADIEEQGKLEELRKLLQQEPDRIEDQTEQRRSKASELVESEIISATEARHGYQARMNTLRDDIKQLDGEMSAYADNLKGFDALKLNLNFAKQESEQMAQVYVDSRLRTLTSQHAITDVSVIDAPTWDWHPASPKKKMVILATIGLLVMGSFAVVLACIALDTTVADSKTAELRLGAPVVSILPLARPAEGAAPFPEAFTTDNHREFARMYQSAQLSTHGAGRGGKVILVAEAAAGEGASLLGYGLARFLSRDAHERTAFLDCSANSIAEALSATDRAASEPSLLPWPSLKQGQAGVGKVALAALEEFRREFDYVVVAGGAVREATDLLTIGGIVASTFLIIEAGKTRRAAARYSLELLRLYGFQGIKLILNKRVFYVPSWLMRFV
jgi:uncharacterized protein involved in exopolysaccharide biosynthesis